MYLITYLLSSLLLFGLCADLSAQEAKSDSVRVFALIDIAKEKQAQGFPDSAEHYFKKAGQLVEELDSDIGRIAYAGHYAVFLYQQVRYDEALTLAKQQLAASLKVNNKQKASYGYNNMALQYQAQGKLKQAAEALMKALELSSGIENPTHRDLSDRRKFYNNLSSLLLDLNDIDKGLQYGLKSLEIAEELQDTVAVAMSLVNILVAEAMANKLTDAEQHALQLLAIGQSHGDVQTKLTAYINLSDIYRRQDRLPLALETYQKAEVLLQQAPPGNEVYVLSGIATVYKNMGQYHQASSYFDKALVLAREELAKPKLIELYLSGAEIKEGLGNYRQALQFRKQYERLSDSLLNRETQQTIQELEVKYQAAEKEKSIAEQALKISEQQAQLDRKNKWIVLAVALVLLLVLLLMSSRLISQQKRRTEASKQENRLLEAQLKGEEEERARTARELHDGVASILSAAKLQVNALADGHPIPQLHIGQLIESAVQEIRNISHNLAPEIVLTEGFAYAIQEFCQRIRRPGLQLECYIIGAIPQLDKKAELLLYRIVQESVTNMVKHADATEGIVQVVDGGNRLAITIEDNGKGFDPEQLTADGIGLKNLSSRIQLVGGTYEIRSAPGKGTSIYIEIGTDNHRPVKREGAEVRTYG
ncbi:hypothetical protein GCM10007415_11860 [Parapedobacter pyrenivorans]|uniref:Oxygen sensor histidine kinase NreB n=1 Tax=Parapedobacter pyrenivorans TaxID=1305674 RepID=A0A917HJD1_9SPHI|nr:sensor histidine kinase [Parapedobacter pyrenivorans]GGG80949.1 hypothetical protein GCM10007415_11860 [Parapedobacter pyrenivorans]